MHWFLVKSFSLRTVPNIVTAHTFCPGGGGGGTPIIFSWGCAAGTLRTLTYTRQC